VLFVRVSARSRCFVAEFVAEFVAVDEQGDGWCVGGGYHGSSAAPGCSAIHADAAGPGSVVTIRGGGGASIVRRVTELQAITAVYPN
jgi:hypothetical protein